MTPEQREELKAAATDLVNADDHSWPTYQARFKKLVGPAAILSLIAQVEALTVPKGWKMVPIEPTAEMLVAGAESDDKDFGPVIHNCYASMLDAAPTIPAIPGTKEGA